MHRKTVKKKQKTIETKMAYKGIKNLKAAAHCTIFIGSMALGGAHDSCAYIGETGEKWDIFAMPGKIPCNFLYILSSQVMITVQ